MACHGWEKPPTTQAKFLQQLHVLPAWLDNWRRSAARRASMRILALTKAHYPDVDTELLTKGWPCKSDGTPLTKEDIKAIDVKTRHHATVLTDNLSLSTFQVGYTAEGAKLSPKEPALTGLDPSYRAPLPTQPEVAPESGTSNVPAPPRPASGPFSSVFEISWEDAEGLAKRKSKKKSAASGSSGLAPETPVVPAESGPAA